MKALVICALLALGIILLTRCTLKPPIETPPVYNGLWPKAEYTAFTVKALEDLGAGLLKAEPKDIEKYCANFKSVDRKQFYLTLISQLSKFESSWNTAETYTEDFKDAKGVKVVSRGLLQISQESANSYGCGIDVATKLHDPETNLRCGVRILARWIVQDGLVQGGSSGQWRGAARYWSPFRKDERIASLKKATSNLPGCLPAK